MTTSTPTSTARACLASLALVLVVTLGSAPAQAPPLPVATVTVPRGVTVSEDQLVDPEEPENPARRVARFHNFEGAVFLVVEEPNHSGLTAVRWWNGQAWEVGYVREAYAERVARARREWGVVP